MPEVSQRPAIVQKIGKAIQGIGLKIASGVRWVGNPDTRDIIAINAGESTPNAERLTAVTAGVTSAYAFAALDWRATRIGEAPLFVALDTDEGAEWIKDHELSRFFANPRPDMSMGEILGITQRYRDTSGAALWKMDRDRAGRFGAIVPFSAWEFRVKQSPGLIFGEYSINVRGNYVPVKREDVVHFRDLFGTSWTEPTSRLEVALQNVNLGHDVTRMLTNYMRRAMFPGGVISPDPKWDPDDQTWQKWKDAVRAWHSGPARAGESLAVKGGTTFTRAALGMADLVPSEVLDRVEAAIGSIFGIPPIVLGWALGLRNSPWSQAEQMESQAYSNTVVPIWTGIAETLTRTLLSAEDREKGLRIMFDTSAVRALQEDDEERARVAAMNARIWTLDESRVYTGMEKIGGEKGDTLVADLAFAAMPTGGNADDPNADDDAEDDEEEDEVEDAAAEADAKIRKRARARIARKAAKAIWSDFDTATKANEPSWEAAVYAELQQQRSDVMKLATKTLEQAKAIDRDSADEFQMALGDMLKKAQPRMKAVVHPLLLSTGGQAVRALSSRIGVGFDLLQPGLNAYAAREADFLVGVMGETTGQLVAAAVQKGLREGDTIGRMVERLGELPAFTQDRAKLVARTETTRAWNGAQRGSLSAYAKESGRVAVKTWLSSQDARVREEHAALDGEQKGIDEPFSNGLQSPGEPNCRCTLTYGVADSIRGNG